MKKGMSTSSIGIIAVLGVAVVVGWMTYQNMAGSGATDRIDQVTTTTESRALLETVKRTLKTDLIYSSQEGSMDVAIAGGGDNCGITGTRHWVSGGEFTAPTEEEVLCSLSNTSHSLMSQFVIKEREQYDSKNVLISDYDCLGSYNPSEEACYPYIGRDIPVADAFQNGLTGGTIEVKGKGGQQDRYEGNIVADIAPNQFWPIYYTLYNFIRDDFNIIVTSTLRDECPDDTLSTSQKVIDGVEEACKKLHEEFCGSDIENCCINVTCEIECPKPGEDVSSESCFDGLAPEPFNKELCFEPKHTDEGKSSDKSPSGLLIAQGTTVGSYRVKIDAVDECHKLNAKDYLDWRLYIVDTLGTNCEVVDEV
ncbi:MAG: hypothetical protein U9Q92_07800 [archaeon]|nr:hypothetical protein [archaeon]